MKRKHTQAKKARRYNERQTGLHTMSIFWRRVNNIYGADHLSFDARHPDIEPAADGLRQRIALAKAQRKAREDAK